MSVIFLYLDIVFVIQISIQTHKCFSKKTESLRRSGQTCFYLSSTIEIDFL